MHFINSWLISINQPFRSSPTILVAGAESTRSKSLSFYKTLPHDKYGRDWGFPKGLS